MNPNPNLDPMGKMPPQAIEIEEAILGAIMIERDAMHTVLSTISSHEAFYKEAHQRIYRAILSLFRNHEPIDLLTVNAQLRKTGELATVGGSIALSSLSNKVNSAAHIEHHCRIVQEAFIRRTIIENSQKAIREAFDDTADPLKLMDTVMQDLLRMQDGLSSKREETLAQLVPAAMDDIENNVGKGGLTGVPSGFKTVDEITGGWQDSDLIILAARPGQGKTTFVLNSARNASVTFKKKIAFFSLEMSGKQLATKLIASEVGRSTSELTKGKIQSKEEIADIRKRVGVLELENMIIDDTPGISLNQIRAKAHKWKAQYGIELIIIDYLQLITAGGKGGNREQEISSISRGLKVLAKELNVPVIALSQLSRQVESRPDKRPQLSDLRESGAIEQDADMVIFLLRFEYYGMKDEGGAPLENLCEVAIAKHRNGKVCVQDEALMLGCKMKHSKFYDLGEENQAITPPRFNFPSNGDTLNAFESDRPDAPF